MQNRALLLGVLLLLSMIAASCGDDDGASPGTDTGPRADGGSIDLGSARDTGPDRDTSTGTDAGRDDDAGPAMDAGPRADAAPAADAASGDDAGPAADAGTDDDGSVRMCGSDGLGDFCEETECRSGFECRIGRCIPQSREICGGFAGAECTDPLYPVCLYFSTADFGPCFTRAEATCLCDRARGSFACP